MPVLPDLDRLAAVELMNREYGRAEAACRRALLIRERVEGKSDPDLIQTLDGLAYSMFGQKKFDDAERVLNRSGDFDESFRKTAPLAVAAR